MPNETGDKIATYVKGHPPLNGRVLFTNGKRGSPDAAIMILNNARQDLILSMVKKAPTLSLITSSVLAITVLSGQILR